MGGIPPASSSPSDQGREHARQEGHPASRSGGASTHQGCTRQPDASAKHTHRIDCRPGQTNCEFRRTGYARHTSRDLHALSASRLRSSDLQRAISTGLLRPRAARRAAVERVCSNAARHPCAPGRHFWFEPFKRGLIAPSMGQCARQRGTSCVGLLAVQIMLAEHPAQSDRGSRSLAVYRTGKEEDGTGRSLIRGVPYAPFLHPHPHPQTASARPGKRPIW